VITFMIFNSALVHDNENHSHATVGTDLRLYELQNSVLQVCSEYLKY